MVSRHLHAESGSVTQLVLQRRGSKLRHVGSLDLVIGVPGCGDVEPVWDWRWGLGGMCRRRCVRVIGMGIMVVIGGEGEGDRG